MKYFDAFEGKFSVVGDVELLEEDMIFGEGSFESLISQVVVDEVEYFETRSEQFGNVAKCVITDFATVEFEMGEIGVRSY